MKIRNNNGDIVQISKKQEKSVKAMIAKGDHEGVSKLVSSFSKKQNGGKLLPQKGSYTDQNGNYEFKDGGNFTNFQNPPIYWGSQNTIDAHLKFGGKYQIGGDIDPLITEQQKSQNPESLLDNPDPNLQPPSFNKALTYSLQQQNPNAKAYLSPQEQKQYNNYSFSRGLGDNLQKGGFGQPGMYLGRAIQGFGQGTSYGDVSGAANLGAFAFNGVRNGLGVASSLINDQRLRNDQNYQRYNKDTGKDRPQIDNNYYNTGAPYGENRNQAYALGGSVNDLKSDNPNVEVEGREMLQLPNGMAGMINGLQHSEGGEDINAPQDTRVFSDKLKLQIGKNKPKSYAQLAKPFDTEDDMTIKDDSMQTNIAKKTAELNIKFKNQKLDKLFQTQENMKMSGQHGKDIQIKAMQENQPQAKNGGTIDWMAPVSQPFFQMGGQLNLGLVPTAQNGRLVGKQGIGEDNFSGDLDNVYNYASSQGYNGKKDISNLQSWATTADPRGVADYMERVKPNRKAEEIWKQNYNPDYKFGNTKEIDMSVMTPNERVSAFGDNLWDYRFPLLSSGQSPQQQQTPVTQGATSKTNLPINNSNSSNYQKSIFQEGLSPAQTLGETAVLAERKSPVNYIEDQGAKDALSQYNKGNYLNIQPQLNSNSRGLRTVTSQLTGDPTGVANLQQAAANKYIGDQNAYGQKYNYDSQVDSKDNSEISNLLLHRGASRAAGLTSFEDKIARRDAATTDSRINALSSLSEEYSQNVLENRQAVLVQDMFRNYGYNGLTSQFDPKTGRMLFVPAEKATSEEGSNKPAYRNRETVTYDPYHPEKTKYTTRDYENVAEQKFGGNIKMKKQLNKDFNPNPNQFQQFQYDPNLVGQSPNKINNEVDNSSTKGSTMKNGGKIRIAKMTPEEYPLTKPKKKITVKKS